MHMNKINYKIIKIVFVLFLLTNTLYSDELINTLMKKADDHSAVIKYILDRFSSLYRNAAGMKTEKQLLTANIDFIAFVLSLGF